MQALVTTRDLANYIRSTAKEVLRGNVRLLEDLSTVLVSLSIVSQEPRLHVMGIVMDDVAYWLSRVKSMIPLVYSALSREESENVIRTYMSSLREVAQCLEDIADLIEKRSRVQEHSSSGEYSAKLLDLLGKLCRVAYSLSSLIREVSPVIAEQGEE